MALTINRVGHIYGYLTVLEAIGRNKHRKMMWLCLCRCGNKTIADGNRLVSGETKSCGCLRSEAIKIRFSKDREELIGKVFHNFTVLEYQVSETKRGVLRCLCVCGTEFFTDAHNAKSGHTKSCGCYDRNIAAVRMKTHGLSDHPLYVSWYAAKTRCNNPNYHASDAYSGRGITMCEEWSDNFKSFYDWAMDNGWSLGLTLERKDVNGNYEPDNCEFATRVQQSRNRRCNVVKDLDMAREIRESRDTPSEIAKRFGISVSNVHKVRSGTTWKE